MEPAWIDSGADFSADRVYRYRLWRQWKNGIGTKTVYWILLNPSTADETVLDPTLRRCYRFSLLWGFHRMEIYNLFALRSTDPRELYRNPFPVGDHNDAVIAEIRKKTEPWDVIICGWGAHGGHRARDLRVMTLLRRPVFCLDRIKAGFPKHPLYVSRKTVPFEYTGRI